MRNSTAQATVRFSYLLVILLLLSSQAFGSIHAPKVVIRAEVPQRTIRSGERFEIPVRIAIQNNSPTGKTFATPDDRSAEIEFIFVGIESDFELEAMGYRLENWLLSGSLTGDLDRVVIAVDAGGETWRDSVLLRSAGDQPAQLVRVDANKILRVPDANRFSRPEAVKSGYELATEQPATSASKADRTVRVHGQVYMRVSDTGSWVGVDGTTVYFMQRRDVIDDIELGLAVTSVNGEFDFDVTMDGTHEIGRASCRERV